MSPPLRARRKTDHLVLGDINLPGTVRTRMLICSIAYLMRRDYCTDIVAAGHVTDDHQPLLREAFWNWVIESDFQLADRSDPAGNTIPDDCRFA